MYHIIHIGNRFRDSFYFDILRGRDRDKFTTLLGLVDDDRWEVFWCDGTFDSMMALKEFPCSWLRDRWDVIFFEPV